MQTERLVCPGCGRAIETASDVERAAVLPEFDPHRDPMAGLSGHVVYACADCGEPVGVA